MNLSVIIGNLTRDPEFKVTGAGVQVCNFTVAVNGRGRDAEPAFLRVSTFGKLADICINALRKGNKVCVVGSTKISSYTGKDGSQKSQWEMAANEVEFLSPKNMEHIEEPQPRRGNFVPVDDEPLFD